MQRKLLFVDNDDLQEEKLFSFHCEFKPKEANPRDTKSILTFKDYSRSAAGALLFSHFGNTSCYSRSHRHEMEYSASKWKWSRESRSAELGNSPVCFPCCWPAAYSGSRGRHSTEKARSQPGRPRTHRPELSTNGPTSCSAFSLRRSWTDSFPLRTWCLHQRPYHRFLLSTGHDCPPSCLRQAELWSIFVRHQLQYCRLRDLSAVLLIRMGQSAPSAISFPGVVL